jgi:predicted CXXCH cytochrome family protein
VKALIPLLDGFILLSFLVIPVNADAVDAPAAQMPNNAQCLVCHSQPGQTHDFSGGESMSVTVDPEKFGSSMHSSVSCQVCHPNISSYPHPENIAANKRDYTLQYKDLCEQCHIPQAKENLDSSHTKLFEAGNINAPICADCHNPHVDKSFSKDAVGNLTGESHARIANICAKCHNGIFEQYSLSVHGAGVLVDNNPDVPACTDCHGVHKISGPNELSSFRLTSPNLCAKCHTDASIMDKYGLSTQVLKTYIADFHGTTVTLFQKTDPDQQTNAPVCFDCHGVHDIRRVDDPQKGLQIKENLLATCQRCHPDATSNFPDSWLSHYIPTPQRSPLVYYVDLIYKILIPLVLGAMALFILTDIYRRIQNKRKKPGSGKPVSGDHPQSPTSTFTSDDQQAKEELQ